MSTPQDDIGAAIVATLQAAPFSSYIGAVGYGFEWSKAGKDSEAVALVMPVASESVEDYGDSARRAYAYNVQTRVSNRGMALLFSKLQRDMMNVFRADARTLQDAFTNTSTKALSPTIRATSELVDIEEAEGQSQTFNFEVTATIWEATP